MHRCLPVLAVALATATAVAQEGDPLRSPECIRAVDALQAQEAALAARVEAQVDDAEQQATRAELNRLRQRAAHACLKGRADPPLPPARMAQPPVAVPPVQTPPPPVLRSAQPPALPPSRPLAAPSPLLSVTSCDPAGCWASDGTRLQRVGPSLLGPRGFCSTAGAVLTCP
jgi:hypothetical protein